MQFYDAAVEYTVTVTAKDTGGLSDTDSSTFNYTSCTAMRLDAGTIAFRPVNPGENSTVAGDEDMGTTGKLTFWNIGNMEIDVNITGMNMTSGIDTITKDNIVAQSLDWAIQTWVYHGALMRMWQQTHQALKTLISG